MKCLIVLALAAMAQAAPQYFNSFAIPTVLPDGHIADTPEVAVAKIDHFVAHAKALAGDHIAAAPVVSHLAAPAAAVVSTPYYTGPYAVPTVLPDGHLADTPEVAAAKIAHLSEHAHALANAPAPVVASAAPAVVGTPYFRSFYSGPYAIPTVLPSGHLADTPEVATAKAFHFSAHAKALSLSAF